MIVKTGLILPFPTTALENTGVFGVFLTGR